MGIGPKNGEELTAHWIRQEIGWDIHKYDNASKLYASDWAYLLSYRLHCRTLTNTHPETAQKAILDLFANPLAPQISYEDSILSYGDSILFGDDQDQKSVWDRTVIDDYLGDINFNSPTMRDLAGKCSEYANSEENDCFAPSPHEGEVDRSIDDVRKERGYPLSPVKPVFVDLTATEEKLIADFTQWLRDRHAAMRGELHKRISKKEFTRDFTDADFKKWAQNRVLAYIDLDLFCLLNNKSLSDPTVGELLLPSHENGPNINPTDRVQDTVAPLADKLTRGWYIDVLVMQATRAEQKNIG